MIPTRAADHTVSVRPYRVGSGVDLTSIGKVLMGWGQASHSNKGEIQPLTFDSPDTIRSRLTRIPSRTLPTAPARSATKAPARRPKKSGLEGVDLRLAPERGLPYTVNTDSDIQYSLACPQLVCQVLTVRAE